MIYFNFISITVYHRHSIIHHDHHIIDLLLYQNGQNTTLKQEEKTKRLYSEDNELFGQFGLVCKVVNIVQDKVLQKADSHNYLF